MLPLWWWCQLICLFGGMSWIPKQKQIYKRVLSRHGWPLVIIIIPYDPGSYQHKWRVNRHICRRFWCFWRSAPWMNPKFGRRDPAFWMIKRIISWILFPCVNRPQWISNSQISLKMNRIIEVTLAFFHIIHIWYVQNSGALLGYLLMFLPASAGQGYRGWRRAKGGWI